MSQTYTHNHFPSEKSVWWNYTYTYKLDLYIGVPLWLKSEYRYLLSFDEIPFWPVFLFILYIFISPSVLVLGPFFILSHQKAGKMM